MQSVYTAVACRETHAAGPVIFSGKTGHALGMGRSVGTRVSTRRDFVPSNGTQASGEGGGACTVVVAGVVGAALTSASSSITNRRLSK